ncbi:MAG: ABC transporter permease subunit [Anaerolineae bacterium]
MGNILTIAGREIKAYFFSPLAYILTGVFAFFLGYLFASSTLTSQQADMSGTFSWLMVLSLILTPALAMRLFAEENRMGTIELLMTAPVRDWQIVIGKYIAGLLAFVMLLIPTLWYLVILWRYGSPDWGSILAGYVGVLLAGAAFIGIGMFTSSLTGNQIIAYFVGFLALIFMWFSNALAGIAGGGNFVLDFLGYLSLPTHFQDFFTGVIDSGHAVFFISLAAIAVFLTVRVVESRRWR